jgi:PE-PPE domain
MRGTLPSLFVGDTLVGVTTPAQFRPLTGVDSKTWDASVAGGLDSLREQIAMTDGPKVVFGVSQSATIVAELKRGYLEDRSSAPDPTELSFVVEGNPNRPHTGIAAQFPDVSIPSLGLTSMGPAPETPYDTTDVAREYDPIADFPQYPVNLVATANAVAGFFYIHPHYGGIDLSKVPARNTYQVTNSLKGTTTYYLVPTPKLLLQPLRDIGVPASIVDPLNAALKPIVDAGYRRDRRERRQQGGSRLDDSSASPGNQHPGEAGPRTPAHLGGATQPHRPQAG